MMPLGLWLLAGGGVLDPVPSPETGGHGIQHTTTSKKPEPEGHHQQPAPGQDRAVEAHPSSQEERLGQREEREQQQQTKPQDWPPSRHLRVAADRKERQIPRNHRPVGSLNKPEACRPESPGDESQENNTETALQGMATTMAQSSAKGRRPRQCSDTRLIGRRPEQIQR